jgi:hypothetical protein
MAIEKAQGREAVVAKTESQSEELDPGLRRDDEVATGSSRRRQDQNGFRPSPE